MYKKEFRRFIEEANRVIDRCHARGIRTFDRSMSELADQYDYIEYARKYAEVGNVTYPGKDFKGIPIILVFWFELMHIINMVTAGALWGANDIVFVSVLLGTSFVAMLAGFYISVFIDSIVVQHNVEECSQTLYRIDYCVGSLIEKRQAVKEKSANKADSDAPVDEADSDAPVDEVVSNAPIDE